MVEVCLQQACVTGIVLRILTCTVTHWHAQHQTNVHPIENFARVKLFFYAFGCPMTAQFSVCELSVW